MRREERKARYTQAFALHRAGRYAEALSILEGLHQELPDNRDLAYARALCLAETGRDAEARTALEELAERFGDERARQVLMRLAELETSSQDPSPVVTPVEETPPPVAPPPEPVAPILPTPPPPSVSVAPPFVVSDSPESSPKKSEAAQNGEKASAISEPKRRSMIPLLTGAVVLFVLGLGGGWYMFGSKSTPESSSSVPVSTKNAPPLSEPTPALPPEVPKAEPAAADIPAPKAAPPPDSPKAEAAQVETAQAPSEVSLWPALNAYPVTEFYVPSGDGLIEVALFAAPAWADHAIPGNGSGVALGEAVAANWADVMDFAVFAVDLAAKEGTSASDGTPLKHMAHTVVLPRDGVELSGSFLAKRVSRFRPGQITSLSAAIERAGAPDHAEDWGTVGALGLDGQVMWWGSTGLGADSTGAITHLLVRAFPR